MNSKQIRAELIAMQDLKYLAFTKKLVCCDEKILGIRIPTLRAFAKKIFLEDGIKYLSFNELEYLEEASLQGYIIGYSKLSAEEKIKLIKLFVPKIKNWVTCDTVCTSLEFKVIDKPKLWDFLTSYAKSKKEFEIRFIVVMIIVSFLDSENICRSLNFLDQLDTRSHYASMGVAWAISIALIKFQKITKKYLQTCKLDTKTFNKSLQKACESFRISSKDKETLRKLKRNT